MNKKLKRFLMLSLIYVVFLILGTVLYIGSFWINFIDTLSIPLAGSIVLLCFVCILILILLLCLKISQTFSKILTYRDILLILVLLFFLNYNVYGMIPFNCARSNSIIMVGYLYKNLGKPKTEKEIKEFVEQEYFQTYDAIHKRLQEQVNAGNVKKLENGYILTKRGVFIVRFFGWVTDLYNMDHNFTRL